jgi:amino acid transporter
MFGVVGIIQTLGLVIVYAMGDFAASVFYGREKRREFNLLLHGIIPLVASGLLGYVFYKNVETLHPFSPQATLDYAPLVLIIWAVLGVAILAAMRAVGKEDWLFKAGEAAHERPETPEEAAHVVL